MNVLCVNILVKNFFFGRRQKMSDM